MIKFVTKYAWICLKFCNKHITSFFFLKKIFSDLFFFIFFTGLSQFGYIFVPEHLLRVPWHHLWFPSAPLLGHQWSHAFKGIYMIKKLLGRFTWGPAKGSLYRKLLMCSSLQQELPACLEGGYLCFSLHLLSDCLAQALSQATEAGLPLRYIFIVDSRNARYGWGLASSASV